MTQPTQSLLILVAFVSLAALPLHAQTTVTLTQDSSTPRTTTSGNPLTLQVDGSTVVTQSGVIDGNGALTKAGTGSLTLSAANTYSGNTTISGGTLQLGGNDRLSSATSIFLSAGSTLDLGGYSQTVAGLGTVSSRLVGNITAGTIVNQNASYLQSGTFANTFTGNSTTARLRIGGNNSATVTLSGTNDLVNTTDHRSVIIGDPNTTGSTGTVRITNPNALAAATETVFLSQGRLDLNGQTNVRASAIQLGETASILVNDNTSNAASFAGTVNFSNDGNIGGAGNLELSGALSSGHFVKAGAGTLTLSGNNSAGNFGVDLQAGTLAFTTAQNLGSSPNIAFNGGTLRLGTVGGTTYNNLYFGAGLGALNFDVASGSSATLLHAADDIYAGFLSKTGGGNLTLSGAASSPLYDVTIEGGTLTLAGASYLGDYVRVMNGSTLDLGGGTHAPAPNFGDPTATSIYNNSTLRNGIYQSTGGIYIRFGGTIDATITGSGSDARLWISSGVSSTTYLGGSNERVYTPDHNQVMIGHSSEGGATGTVKLLTSTALTAATENTEIWSGTLDLNGQTNVRGNSLKLMNGTASAVINSDTAHAASFAGGVSLQSNGAKLGGDGALVFSGVVSGTGSFTKIGAGTLTLAGANTYTGTTVINAGRIQLTGTASASAFTVNSGGSLSGTGTLGALTINSGGTVSPGNSPGTLTTGAETWNGGGSYTWEINNATGVVGTNYDLLSISGGLTINATSANKFTINLTSLTLGNVAGNAANFNATSNYSFTFVTTTTGITGFDTTAFTLNTSAFQNPFSGTWSIGQSGNNLTLNYTGASAIPEPSTYAAIFGGCALAFAAWRRRRLGLVAPSAGA